MQALLSFDKAPPFAAPLRFFLTAPLFALAAGLLFAGAAGLAGAQDKAAAPVAAAAPAAVEAQRRGGPAAGPALTALLQSNLDALAAALALPSTAGAAPVPSLASPLAGGACAVSGQRPVPAASP